MRLTCQLKIVLKKWQHTQSKAEMENPVEKSSVASITKWFEDVKCGRWEISMLK